MTPVTRSDREPNARLLAAARDGCAESRLLVSRRGAMGITAGLFSAAFIPDFAEAATRDARLLVVVLRGGMDGINVVAPHGDKAYESMRGAIALERKDTLPLPGAPFFGLNTALGAFHKMYGAGDAAAVHAICTPLRNRSHFDAQDNLESGLPGLASNPTGWLNRLLAALPKGEPIKRHGAIQIGEAPLVLRGPAPVLGWSPTWFSHPPDEITDLVRSVLRRTDRPLADALAAGIKADKLAEKAGPGDDDGLSQLEIGFRGAARLLTTDGGPRVAVLSVGNFDTHSGQGTIDGFLWSSVHELDRGLKVFQENAKAIWPNTAIVMATEFGRTVRINGDAGTDHGVGSVALLAGGAVAGGRILGDWPGIGEKQLFEQSDLRATTDLRALFKGVLLDHLGVPPKLLDDTIFPGSKAVRPMQGLIKGAAAKADAAASAVSGPPVVSLRPQSAIARYRAAGG